MELVLVMFTANDERRDFPLKSKKATIGRNTECSLQIPLAVVSRRHCEIRAKNGKVMVRDLGSSNGTYVNDKRVQEAELQAGDVLKVGPVNFTVVMDGQPENIVHVRTIVEKPKKSRSKGDEAPKNPEDTDSSIDLDESAAPLDLQLEEHDEDEKAANPLAELEALSRQKKA